MIDYPLLYVCERCDHEIRTAQSKAIQHRRAVSAHSLWHKDQELREAEEELWKS